MREPRAYNNSIYLMVAMPYLLLGGIVGMVYRGYRRQHVGNGSASLMAEERPENRSGSELQ